MSWAEVKKLNSDLSTPLNLAALINHIDLVGSNYVGYGDADTSVEICKTNGILVHSIASQVVLRESLSTQEKMDSYGYKCLCAITNTDYSTFTDFADMLASETAMNAIAASETAMNAIIASSTAMNAIIASETAMNAIIASSTAMTAVVASKTALLAIFSSAAAVTQVLASSSAVTKLDNSPFAITNPTMTSDTLPAGYVALASSIGEATYLAYKAFDGMTDWPSAHWLTNNSAPGWVQLKFPKNVYIYKGKYGITPTVGRVFRKVQIQSSVDGATFTNITPVVSVTPSTTAETEIVFESSACANYWRVDCTDGASPSYGNGLSEFTFYGLDLS